MRAVLVLMVITLVQQGKAVKCGKFNIPPGEKVPFQSPNYPKKYKKSSTCTWEFTCDNTEGTIDVSCDAFATQKKKKCTKADYLKVSDGNGVLGTFCGKKGPDLTTSDNYLNLKFGNNRDKKTDTGFSCTAICNVPSTTTTSTTTTTTTPKPTTTTTTTTPKPTTTTTSTTTTTPEPTTTTSSVTTTNSDWGGECTLDLTMSDGEVANWLSPNYDGLTANYPEGDYCCWLNITIPSKYIMFAVTMQMSSNSKIHESKQCLGDLITYYGSDNTSNRLCGDLSDEHWIEVAFFDAPKSFGFQWCSVKSDGGTDLGFNMTITGTDLNTGR